MAKVDWNQVAQDMEITNGHAARMRFARFKNQMEGTVPKARAPRDKSKAPKAKRVKTKDEKKEEAEEKTMLKLKIEDSVSPMEGQVATPISMISESDIRQATGPGTISFDEAQMQMVKPEPIDEVRLEDLDAPGEAIDASELAHHDSQMASVSDQAQAAPELLHHHEAPHNHDLYPDLPFQQNQPQKPEGQHEYHHLPQQAGNSAEYSRASSFSFSNDLMAQLSPQMYLPIMEEGCSQNTMSQEMRLPSPNTFFDPYVYQQQHMGINGHGQIVKSEQPWDSSYC